MLGPTYRIDRDTMHHYGRIVADEAAGLSEQLGFAHEPLTDALPDPLTGQETTS